MATGTSQIVILTSPARKDLPEVRPLRLAPTVIEGAMDCSAGRACPVLFTGGAVAERLRCRLLPYANCFPFSLFLLFCRVKREAENPFEIETHGSISPQDTHGPYRTARCT